nr:ribosome biogenesis protein BMS1/TSR1, AARP2CN [Tanacetum cinerariifolium]
MVLVGEHYLLRCLDLSIFFLYVLKVDVDITTCIRIDDDDPDRSEAEDGSDNGCLDCDSDNEPEDGSDNSKVVDEGEQDFTNPTYRRKFDLEDGQALLKLKDFNDETDNEALLVGDYHFFK